MSDALLTREAFVEALVRTGVARAAAERQAERQYGPAVVALAREDVLEKKEQQEVVKIYRAFGCTVYWLSQPRATKQSAGLPDLRVFAPRVRRCWDHETKRQGRGEKDLEPAQRDYRNVAEQCGLEVVVGDRHDAGRQLVRLGLATLTDTGALEPARSTTPPDPYIAPGTSTGGDA